MRLRLCGSRIFRAGRIGRIKRDRRARRFDQPLISGAFDLFQQARLHLADGRQLFGVWKALLRLGRRDRQRDLRRHRVPHQRQADRLRRFRPAGCGRRLNGCGAIIARRRNRAAGPAAGFRKAKPVGLVQDRQARSEQGGLHPPRLRPLGRVADVDHQESSVVDKGRNLAGAVQIEDQRPAGRRLAQVPHPRPRDSRKHRTGVEDRCPGRQAQRHPGLAPLDAPVRAPRQIEHEAREPLVLARPHRHRLRRKRRRAGD